MLHIRKYSEEMKHEKVCKKTRKAVWMHKSSMKRIKGRTVDGEVNVRHALVSNLGVGIHTGVTGRRAPHSRHEGFQQVHTYKEEDPVQLMAQNSDLKSTTLKIPCHHTKYTKNTSTLSGDAGEGEHRSDAVRTQRVCRGLHTGKVLHREGHLAVSTEQLRQGSAGGLQNVLGADIHLVVGSTMVISGVINTRRRK